MDNQLKKYKETIHFSGQGQDISESSLLKIQNFELKIKIDKLIEALQWCSGSDDFQHPDGKARLGWEKLCKPLLDTKPYIDYPKTKGNH